ncbi:MAG: lipoyl synthase [Candidatus Omnitrophota bacterium]|jgi:lipoic acid synthetase
MKNKLPSWFKQEIPDAAVRGRIQMFSEFNVNTVCSLAKCPNLSACFKDLKFTFMILGDTCTRGCRFCGINKKEKEPLPLDENEPDRLSQIARVLKLKFIVITSVTRDDLVDGGAAQFVRSIKLLHGISKDIKIEALVPDFSGSGAAIKAVVEAGPSIFAHNIETVKRLYGRLRPGADYDRSLGVLSKAREVSPSLVTKSSLILGMGETEDEVIYAMQDLRQSGCDILTLGQYLAPSEKHFPVEEFIGIEQFENYRRTGKQLGFKAVLSGPKVRSSYKAEEVFNELNYL